MTINRSLFVTLLVPALSHHCRLHELGMATEETWMSIRPIVSLMKAILCLYKSALWTNCQICSLTSSSCLKLSYIFLTCTRGEIMAVRFCVYLLLSLSLILLLLFSLFFSLTYLYLYKHIHTNRQQTITHTHIR